MSVTDQYALELSEKAFGNLLASRLEDIEASGLGIGHSPKIEVIRLSFIHGFKIRPVGVVSDINPTLLDLLYDPGEDFGPKVEGQGIDLIPDTLRRDIKALFFEHLTLPIHGQVPLILGERHLHCEFDAVATALL